MSVYCRLASSELWLKALSTVFVHKDCWATVVFTDTAVVLHVEGDDQSTTATAVLPKAVFTEYAVTDASLCVHVNTLMDALLMLGPSTVQSPHTRTVLAYPTSDSKLLVEVADATVGSGDWGADAFGRRSESVAGSSRGGGRVFQSKLVTRPIKAHVLDLRFQDAALQSQATVLGDTLRSIVQDLVHCNCARVEIDISTDGGVRLRGVGSPFGEVDIWLKPQSDALLAVEDTAKGLTSSAPARTCVSTRHLAVACGVRTGGGSGVGGSGRGGGGAGSGDGNGPANISSGAAATNSGAGGVSGFERLTMQINSQGQLGVIHMQRSHEVKATVTVIVGAAFNYETL